MKRLFALVGTCLLLTILGCQLNETPEIALSDSTSITGMTGDSVKLVKTASIHFKVKDVEQSAKAVSYITQQLGGMIFHQNLKSIEGERKELKVSTDSIVVITAFTPHADITARIPSQNLESFIFSISDLGYYTSNSKMDIDDKSLNYLENTLKQKSRSVALSTPNPIKTKGVSTLEGINVNDEAIEKGINNRIIDANVKYSTVTLSLFQNTLVKKEVVANYYISDYSLPFVKRLKDSISAGMDYFLNFVLVVFHLWVFLLAVPILWILYKKWQQKMKIGI